MSEFNPKKLHVDFIGRENIQEHLFPRRYTLIHSDKTGDLFLSIGSDFDYRKFSNFYSKLMRDEVLGEWQNEGQKRLDLHCHCSGGIALGPARWRESIFRQHMEMVLKAICYGDKSFLLENKDFLHAPIYVHFHRRHKKLDYFEKWGIISDYVSVI